MWKYIGIEYMNGTKDYSPSLIDIYFIKKPSFYIHNLLVSLYNKNANIFDFSI